MKHSSNNSPLSNDKLNDKFIESIEHIQTDMTRHEKLVSRFIHIPAIETISDLLAGTLAKPNILLAGSIGVLVIPVALYMYAKSVGYTLSGFEPVAAFIAGCFIGILYDFFRVMITGKK